jgi:hypothetical protein
MAKGKISQLDPKGSNLSSTDLFEVSVNTGSGYDTYSITGQEIIDGGSGVYVPYTGATQDVDLDTNKLSAESVYIEGTAGSGHLHLKHQSSDATASGQSTALFADANGDIKYKNDNDYYTTLKTSLNTADRVYTFPNSDCTLTPDSRTINTTAPLSGGGDLSANRTLSISQATTSTDGYLSKSDWTNFDSKQNALVSGTNIKTVQSTSLLGSGDITITDANLSTSDITTNDVSITKHGFVPKAPNDITKFLRGDGTWATAGGGLTVGTTAITSGTVGRILFEGTGNVLQEDSALFWDNTNKRLGVGATPSTSVRLDVRAQGALSTDITFRVRNSADTADLISFRGDGSQWIQSVPFIHAGTLTGGTNTTQSLYIGYNSVALATSGTRNTIIGTGTGTTPSGLNQTAIGHSVNTGGWSTSIAIGVGATLTSNNSCMMGSEAYPFSTMGIGTGGLVESAANIQNMNLFVGGVKNGFTLNTSAASKYFRLSAQNGSGTGEGAPIQFATAPSGVSGFSSNANVVFMEIRGDGKGLNHYQLSTPRVPSASLTDGYIQYSNDITAGNAAPHFRTENGAIVKVYQETTGVAAATLVGGGGTALTDTDTFDGYTLKQIVKALRNQGLLA